MERRIKGQIYFYYRIHRDMKHCFRGDLESENILRNSHGIFTSNRNLGSQERRALLTCMYTKYSEGANARIINHIELFIRDLFVNMLTHEQ